MCIPWIWHITDFNIFIFIQIFHPISLLCCCKVCCESLIFKVRRCFQCCIIIERFLIFICPLVKLITSFCCYCRWLGRMLCCRAISYYDLTSFTVSEDFINSSNLTCCSCHSSFIIICWYIGECDLILIRDIILISIFAVIYIYNVLFIVCSYCKVISSYKGISTDFNFLCITFDLIPKVCILWIWHCLDFFLCIFIQVFHPISLLCCCKGTFQYHICIRHYKFAACSSHCCSVFSCCRPANENISCYIRIFCYCNLCLILMICYIRNCRCTCWNITFILITYLMGISGVIQLQG